MKKKPVELPPPVIIEKLIPRKQEKLDYENHVYMIDILKAKEELAEVKTEETEPDTEEEEEIEYDLRINYMYVGLLVLACLCCVMQYSSAVIVIDGAKIWGKNGDVSEFKLETASNAGIYGATAGCGIGSILLTFGRQKVMLIFVCLALLGLII